MDFNPAILSVLLRSGGLGRLLLYRVHFPFVCGRSITSRVVIFAHFCRHRPPCRCCCCRMDSVAPCGRLFLEAAGEGGGRRRGGGGGGVLPMLPCLLSWRRKQQRQQQWQQQWHGRGNDDNLS